MISLFFLKKNAFLIGGIFLYYFFSVLVVLLLQPKTKIKDSYDEIKAIFPRQNRNVLFSKRSY